jgi:hypothetical protein
MRMLAVRVGDLYDSIQTGKGFIILFLMEITAGQKAIQPNLKGGNMFRTASWPESAFISLMAFALNACSLRYLIVPDTRHLKPSCIYLVGNQEY